MMIVSDTDRDMDRDRIERKTKNQIMLCKNENEKMVGGCGRYEKGGEKDLRERVHKTNPPTS